jgi:hypothetical protein
MMRREIFLAAENDRSCQPFSLFLKITFEWMDGLPNWRKTQRPASNSSTFWMGKVQDVPQIVCNIWFSSCLCDVSTHVLTLCDVSTHFLTLCDVSTHVLTLASASTKSASLLSPIPQFPWRSSWFSSVSADQWQSDTSNQTTNVPFYDMTSHYSTNTLHCACTDPNLIQWEGR